jgi:hypothetical protein
MKLFLLSFFLGLVSVHSEGMSLMKYGVLRGSAADDGAPAGTNVRELQISCTRKKVRIRKFCINGDDDWGPWGEHQLRLDDRKYWPRSSSDCPQTDAGFCDWREGQCHVLYNSPYWNIASDLELSVGTEEFDPGSENDSTTVNLPPEQWYNPTCNTYQVRISEDFSPAENSSICWSFGGSIPIGPGTVNADVKKCSSSTLTAGSYVWYVEVRRA